jgi:hypothetical protein
VNGALAACCSGLDGTLSHSWRIAVVPGGGFVGRCEGGPSGWADSSRDHTRPAQPGQGHRESPKLTGLRLVAAAVG